MSKNSASNPSAALPWWRERMMWLVVGGPASVVLASFVTLGLAISHPDPVLAKSEEGQSQRAGSAADLRTDSAAMSAAMTPAMRARNHAATGGH